MTTYYTLTGDLSDTLGDDPKGLQVWVQANLDPEEALADLDANEVFLVGATRVPLTGSTFSIDLIGTGSTGTNLADPAALRYTITVRYITEPNVRRVLTVSNFAITADLDLSDAIETADPLASASNALLAEMQELRDEVALISGLTGEDDAVAALVANPASDTSAALSAAIEAGAVIPLIESGGTYPTRPAGATAVAFIGSTNPAAFMEDDDLWIDPAAAPALTAADVAADIVDPDSDIGQSIVAVAGGDHDALAVGESTLPRHLATQVGNGPTSGRLCLTYFTARKSQTVASVRTITGNQAAATVTLCRVGIYSINGSGDLTLIASTPNDTSMWTATGTRYTKALSASVDLVAGQRYAIGLLAVASTMPRWNGVAVYTGAEAGEDPRICGNVDSQSDLPSSVGVGSIGNGVSTCFYTVLLP